ncbi:cytochrome b [Ideonella sp. B508-1]|uniref:cytochrome b n=1 Tax=Ideonella sp. B508-1 TaxID=137716 RepID=UPI00034AACC4|nr:cytochrome b/b6 domain-containing protein [Ideonella sp. B508-1]
MFFFAAVTAALLAMSLASSNAHYDPLSRVFHWLTAIAVVVAFTLGPEHLGSLIRSGVDPATRWDIVWHESLGLLVFVLTLLRLVWVAVRPAAPRFDMSPWQHRAARLVQAALWLLMLLLPITAVLALGSKGHPLTLLGGVRLDPSAIVNGSLATEVRWGKLHGLLGDAILWLAGAHAAAAIFHHVVLKDGVLKSMLPPR